MKNIIVEKSFNKIVQRYELRNKELGFVEYYRNVWELMNIKREYNALGYELVVVEK